MDEEKSESVQRKGRHRKKQLYNTILQQMEFYFSDSNLTKDRFLSQLIQKDPYVELSQFLKFNKIKKLTESIDDLRKVIRKSDILELSEDHEKIRRKTPMIPKENVDECTIYVERISADANHEFLTNLFSDFGKVVYVSIPKYRHNHMNKGFAFVEFETVQEAQNAVRYFDYIGCKMSSNINPRLLCSISSYNIENEIQVNKIDENEKHVNVIIESETGVDKNNQVYSNDKSELISKSLKRKYDDVLIGPNKKLKSEEVDYNEEVPTRKESTECKKKKKKELKKKNFIKELGIQILSKQEWKKMRNGYLNLQRKKMKEIKLHLNQSKFSKPNSIGKNVQNIESRPIKEQLEEKPLKLDYIPGTIVKMTLQEPLQSDKKIKLEIKAIAKDIKYVDIPSPSGGFEVFMRFSTNEAALKFCIEEYGESKCILEGDEEKSYWKKIEIDRIQKFQKSNRKQRGKDKLLKKAEQNLAKHSRFDENE